MVCNIARPDPQVLFNRYRDLFSTTVLGGAQVIEESNEWYAVGLNYAIAEDFYAITEQSWKERDPRQNCAENLVLMASNDGYYPLPSVPAQGFLKLSGVANAVLTVPISFTVGENQYVTAVNSGQPTQLDANGGAVVRVRAVVSGSVGNINEITGTIDVPILDVDNEVEVCGGTFCGGSDVETESAFRSRYLRRLQYQPRATNAWILDKLLEWPCATRAITREGSCCHCTTCEDQTNVLGSLSDATNCEDCGCVECGGRMHFYLMFDNSFANGIPSESVIKEAETWLFGSPQGYGLGQVEIGVCGRIAPVTAVLVDVFVDVVDCLNSGQLTSINTIIEEFFTTVEPSKPFNTSSLQSTLIRSLGDVDVDVRVELVNAEDGYGDLYGEQDENSKVYVTACGLEPDCDFMIALNGVSITQSNVNSGVCS